MEYKAPTDIETLRRQVAELNDQIEEMRGETDDVNQPLATVSGQKKIQPVKIQVRANRLLRGHFGKIYSMHWAMNSKNLVSASQDGKLLIWNAYTTHKLHAIPLKSSWVMTCSMSADPTSSLVACGGLDNMCSVYKIPEPNEPHQKHKPIGELAHHEGYLSCCRFIGKEKIITSSGDSTCILWDVNSKQVMRSFHGHQSDVMSVSIWDENTFISGACDATIKVWDMRVKGAAVNSYGDKKHTVHKTHVGHESDVNSVQMFPDGNAFASGSDDSTCRMFDIRAHRQVNRYGSDKLLCGITSVDFSLSGRFLCAGYDNQNCLLWDTLTATQAADVAGHENRVSCLGFSKDGKALCTGSWDTFLKVWG